jgi:hypothetical protein
MIQGQIWRGHSRLPRAMAILEQQRRSSTNKFSSGRIQEAIAHTNSRGPKTNQQPIADSQSTQITQSIRDNKRKKSDGEGKQIKI